MKKSINTLTGSKAELEGISGGKKKLINSTCCQEGATVNFYAHSFLGIQWTSKDVVGKKDDCA